MTNAGLGIFDNDPGYQRLKAIRDTGYRGAIDQDHNLVGDDGTVTRPRTYTLHFSLNLASDYPREVLWPARVISRLTGGRHPDLAMWVLLDDDGDVIDLHFGYTDEESCDDAKDWASTAVVVDTGPNWVHGQWVDVSEYEQDIRFELTVVDGTAFSCTDPTT